MDGGDGGENMGAMPRQFEYNPHLPGVMAVGSFDGQVLAFDLMSLYIYICVYMYIYVCVYIYIYMDLCLYVLMYALNATRNGIYLYLLILRTLNHSPYGRAFAL
jgi:hypothetical protein